MHPGNCPQLKPRSESFQWPCRLEDLVHLCGIADEVAEQLQEAEAQSNLSQLLAYLGATVLTPEESVMAKAAC